MTFPHCPNPQCQYFRQNPKNNWFWKMGYYQSATHGTIQRFICRKCKKTFSAQSFSIDYCTHIRVDYRIILEHLISASGINDLCRRLGLNASTIQNRIERLSRCAMAIHSQCLKSMEINEDIVADGLESFTYSQYFPNHINMAVGSQSEFIYAMGFANLRRKGRMSPAQKTQRQKLERFARTDPKSLEKSFGSILDFIGQLYVSKGYKKITLITDEHKAYPRAIKRFSRSDLQFYHKRISSKKPRRTDNPLFAVNYVDRQIRKDVSDHVRDTVQFAKSPSAMMSRMEVYRFHHNYLIARRVKEQRRGCLETHAEHAGLERKKWMQIKQRYWLKRVFLSRMQLGEQELKTWRCQWRNPGMEAKCSLANFAVA